MVTSRASENTRGEMIIAKHSIIGNPAGYHGPRGFEIREVTMVTMRIYPRLEKVNATTLAEKAAPSRPGS
jgi:hypothetical protein